LQVRTCGTGSQETASVSLAVPPRLQWPRPA
jgi:hypothetical protein